MFCVSRDGLLYLLINNGACAFIAGVLFTLLALSIAATVRSDLRARRKVQP